jgi:hypothetical protein
VTHFELSAGYWYLGALNYLGERYSLRSLQQDLLYGVAVTAIDLNPDCYSHPFRVFVNGTPDEALATLKVHCTKYPNSKISARILTQITLEDFEWAPFVVKNAGKYFAPNEDYISGIGLIRNPKLLTEHAGGAYRSVALKEFPNCDLEVRRDRNGCLVVSGVTPERNYIEFAPASKNQSGPEQALEAWQNAAEKKFAVLTPEMSFAF